MHSKFSGAHYQSKYAWHPDMTRVCVLAREAESQERLAMAGAQTHVGLVAKETTHGVPHAKLRHDAMICRFWLTNYRQYVL